MSDERRSLPPKPDLTHLPGDNENPPKRPLGLYNPTDFLPERSDQSQGKVAENGEDTLILEREATIDVQQFFQHDNVKDLLSWLDSKGDAEFLYTRQADRDQETRINLTYAKLKKTIETAYKSLKSEANKANQNQKSLPTMDSVRALLIDIPRLRRESGNKNSRSFQGHVVRLILKEVNPGALPK